MTKNNDERILELKKQIEVKRAELGKKKIFSPVTNCILILDDKTYNLHTLNKEQLEMLLLKLHLLIIANKSLIDGEILDHNVLISGYSVEDWGLDVVSKLNIIKQKEQETQLKKMESKLTQLLSDKKKVELEIDEIENLLK